MKSTYYLLECNLHGVTSQNIILLVLEDVHLRIQPRKKSEDNIKRDLIVTDFEDRADRAEAAFSQLLGFNISCVELWGLLPVC
jgi:hypothetical protein